MVGFHISMYAKIQSLYLNTTFAAWFTLHYILFDWPSEPPKVCAKLFLLLLSPLYLIMTLFLTIVTLLGYIINLIPLVRWLIELIVILIWQFIIVPMALLLTIYNSTDYTTKLTYFDQNHIF